MQLPFSFLIITIATLPIPINFETFTYVLVIAIPKSLDKAYGCFLFHGFSTAQKMKFFIKDLVSFTEEIFHGKLHFLCSVW